MTDKKNLLLLFDRPTEPVFMEKGRSSTFFHVPDEFLTDRYRTLGGDVQSRFGEMTDKRVPVREIKLPDLSLAMSLDRDEQFSLFMPRHRRIAARLIDIFLEMPTTDDLLSVAVYARDRVNPYLFNYALSVALMHRPDTKGLDIPSFAQNFPDKFMDSQIFRLMREEASVVPEGSRIPIIVPRNYTASDSEPEHRLWYFREDMGVNLHHWHWHLVYPYDATDIRIIAKDRRGELFYYMHHQILARYNMERFSNNLARVKRITNFQEPIPEGYFPKMDSLVSSRAWPPRFENSRLRDMRHETERMNVDVADLDRWRNRIIDAIHLGFAVDYDGNAIPLDERQGIDVLGNMVEATLISPNLGFYGNFHNIGHVLISFTHDPDHRHLEPFGVMGDTATAMRDPVFYRFHANIDEIFEEHKIRLPRYTPAQLQYEGISVSGVQVIPEGDGTPNILSTFWQQSDVDMSRGMDFVPAGSIYARFTHLQHTPFGYTINVENASGATRYGTVRIFLAPKTDEHGQELLFNDQRLMMVEMDKFVVQLEPGQNRLKRKSSDSSVTIPFERTFRDLEKDRPADFSEEELEFNFCGCGWPEHMLIPKGLEDGLQCVLFVMVSNYEDDRVDQELVGSCSDAASYCGVRDRKYPDLRSMGFPFDRLPREGVDSLEKFLTSNMATVDVTIRHDPSKTVIRQT
ncbi:phenoloxidase 2-like [Stomoxys calcitrans]|uniref:tyrosinase n=1 Tax=Stomoxys calcitrans TaxID=35570 RepID=A0A1I8Q726_STOCA|nr:phenoloxidase 2-like [Stomoxys calcitrans]